jgi:hypothetical protein
MHTFQRTIVVGRFLLCLTIKMPILHGHCSCFKIKESEALNRLSLLSGLVNITSADSKVNTFLVAHVFFARTPDCVFMSPHLHVQQAKHAKTRGQETFSRPDPFLSGLFELLLLTI